jgi:murein L,D-transpeptidase YafK
VKRPFAKWLVVPALVGAGAIGHARLARGTGSITCPSERAPLLFVDASKHALALCEAGERAGTFTVRLGKHGMGKSREGDEKTPVGRYAIGEARPSASYGSFLPVEYPTVEQRRAGLTGGAIGVHGPDRRVAWLGALVNAFDTTDGCIGIATDEEMATVAQWVRERRARTIALQ